MGFHSQSIDFTNAIYQDDIPSGEPVFVELPIYFNIDEGRCHAVLSWNKCLYGQSKATRLWYEKLKNGLLDRVFFVSKVDPCMCMSNTVICVVYVYDFCFGKVHNMILTM